MIFGRIGSLIDTLIILVILIVIADLIFGLGILSSIGTGVLDRISDLIFPRVLTSVII